MSNIVNLNQKKLLKALESLPANLIYSIASKPFVLRGFDYYKRNRLRNFIWKKDFSLLRAVVHGSRPYSVDFSINNHDLAFSCNCPAWTPSSNCKHVICALITTKNLFQPNSFMLPSQDEEYKESLSGGLFNTEVASSKKAVSGVYSIFIEMESHALDIYVQKNNKKVYPYTYGIPGELKALISAPYSYSYVKLQYLKHYLANYGNKYPIILKSGRKESYVEFDDSLRYRCKTEIDACRDFIKVRKLCLDNVKEIDNCFIKDDFIINFAAKKIGLLKDSSGWRLWEHLFNITNHDDGFRSARSVSFFNIPLKKFKNVQIIFPSLPSKEIPDDLILKVQGEESSINRASHTYRITISPSKQRNAVSILKAECNLEGLRQSPSYNLFNFFISIDNELGSFLKANKRRIFLYQAFFNMLSAKTQKARKNAIKEALSERDFEQYSLKREARNFLKDYLSVFLTTEKQLQLHNGKWTVTPVNKEKEAILYKIPYEILGWKIFKEVTTYDEMLVPSNALYEDLPLLYERCKEHNIELFFKNKRVVRTNWNFAFDASRTSGIDWFEIKPEIRSNGEAIDDSLWMEMLNKKSIIEKDDHIQILDSNSQRIFNIISTIYKTGNLSKTSDREKAIVRVPRLQILDWIELRLSGVKVKLPPADEEIIERLSQFEKIEKRLLPEKMKAKLRPYQKDGYHWLSFLYEHRFGACLADDMGLGKTVEAITLLGGIKEGRVKCPVSDKAHLIVVPPTLLFNWENEIKRFYPDLNIYLYTGRERNTKFDGYDIVLTTYALVRGDIDKLKDIHFNVIIFDEAQAIKNIYADTTGAVRQLKAYFKLAMTGTPLENHIGEYYSIIDLILPGLLGEYDMFKPLIKQDTSPSLDMIIKRTRPFVLRRTKEKILKELPPKIETDIYLDLTEKQKTLYKKTVEQVKSTIDNAYRSKTGAQAKIIALTAILKLRQLCVSPRLISDDIKEPSPKIDFLINKLKELLDEEHSALVFSQFTSFLDILEEDLKKNGMNFLRLDGSTAVVKRKKLIETFQEEKGPSIFLLSLKAGGQGLNLTKASYVFHLDPWWNPAVENQASDRAHRIGQKNKVTITRILTHHTIEEKMMQLKKKKLALYRAVMEDSSGGKRSLSISKSDFNFLLD